MVPQEITFALKSYKNAQNALSLTLMHHFFLEYLNTLQGWLYPLISAFVIHQIAVYRLSSRQRSQKCTGSSKQWVFGEEKYGSRNRRWNEDFVRWSPNKQVEDNLQTQPKFSETYCYENIFVCMKISFMEQKPQHYYHCHC